MTAALDSPARIDPFAVHAEGEWHGDAVSVHRVDASVFGPRRLRARRIGGRLIVGHRMSPADLCDELATIIVADLGALSHADFEEVFTGVVRSTVAGALDAWLRFYTNSVRRLEAGAAEFSDIHARAAELIRGGRVIDFGSCFGFFPLRLAERGIDVLATDLSAPTMKLLLRMARAMDRPVRTMACNAADVPLPGQCADTVTALHLIEHLTPEVADAVLAEALRLARRRVVVAVPFEDEPTHCYGHVQRFDRYALDRLAERIRAEHTAVRVTVAEHHGGWLIIDRQPR